MRSCTEVNGCAGGEWLATPAVRPLRGPLRGPELSGPVWTCRCIGDMPKLKFVGCSSREGASGSNWRQTATARTIGESLEPALLLALPTGRTAAAAVAGTKYCRLGEDSIRGGAPRLVDLLSNAETSERTSPMAAGVKRAMCCGDGGWAVCICCGSQAMDPLGQRGEARAMPGGCRAEPGPEVIEMEGTDCTAGTVTELGAAEVVLPKHCMGTGGVPELLKSRRDTSAEGDRRPALP